MKAHSIKLIVFLCVFFPIFASAQNTQPPAAQTPPPSQGADDEALKQANNPLASVKAFNIHNYFVPSIYGSDKAFSTQTMLRYAQPVWHFLIRGTLPLVTMSNPDYLAAQEAETAPAEMLAKYLTGLGDAQLFAAYVFYEKEGNELGAGPLFVFPTATNKYLGEGKWQAGVSFIAFFKSNPLIQGGALVTWQMSFAGRGDKDDVNKMVLQPFLMLQLGKGLYLRSSSFWTFDFVHSGLNIPFSMGIGKVLKVKNTVFNIFVEPQYSIINYKFDNGTKFQLFTGLNMQFN